jgi:SAM-dependent MidA family methyltransferase
MASAVPERNGDLRALLRSEADPDGFLPFDRYMEVALYAPGRGYYSRARSPLGPRGDFYTASSAHPLLVATWGEKVAALRAEFPRDRPFLVVEIGPGDGRLTEGVLAALGRSASGVGGVSAVLVERSAPLLAASLERVERTARPLGVPVHTRESVGSIGPFVGVVLAHELLDAQPVRRLRHQGDGWIELGVRFDGDRLLPSERPLRRPVEGPPLPSATPEGNVVEFAPRAEALVREVADHLVAGRFLVADYGMEEGELLAGHPDGTLAAVRGHRSGWDPLEAPGVTDLSAFVNFTRLREVAARAGLRVLSDLRQADALGAWGFPRLLDQAIRSAGSEEAEVRVRLAAKNLLFGFDRFRILELAPAGPAGG